jgi:hypothetical protein
MNAALDRYADNPIIDELVSWPPRSRRIESVRACNPLFRKPFIEVRIDDGEIFQRHFPRPGFERYWAEARVILGALTAIRLQSDFECEPPADAERLAREALATRAECIDECEAMFNEGLYAQFVMQFGEDCSGLPAETERRLEKARHCLERRD